MMLGCFFGAGFVSGREIAFYFARFGWASITSIVIATILFFVLIMFFFMLSNKCNNIDSFCQMYFGKVSKVVNWLLALCVLIISSSMLAGTSSLAEALNVNKVVFLIITLVLAFFAVMGNLQSLSKINMILVPVLIIMMLVVVSRSGDGEVGDGNIFEAIFSSSNYVFINIVTLGMFVLEIGSGYSKKEKLIISIATSIIIGVMSILICLAIIRSGLVEATMPNLELSRGNNMLYISMQICIYFGLFTTLVANILIFSNFLDRYIRKYPTSLAITLILSFMLSSFGFEIIVGYIYSVIGMVGIFMILGVLMPNKKRRFEISSVH